ncbi:hypothetical protein SKAU_G00384150 [Synaphobranchus kaupii]|uniref:UPAR/Ly6 domain-containing protein n=1 Tax=Synaphobranchus kaupii TaxID=118154 RepID=A0A9Q1EEB8_SYNKA|nr:hypothetical protein SKAU_G00384150 [Synaphobranchus kaupii]
MRGRGGRLLSRAPEWWNRKRRSTGDIGIKRRREGRVKKGADTNTGISVIPGRHEAMKVLVFSLALLLILTCGEALECSHCVPSRPGGTCTTTVEKCSRKDDACARAEFLTNPYSHFRRCISMSDCRLLQTNAFIKIRCCDTDLCNA